MESLSDLDYAVHHLLTEYKKLNDDYQSLKKEIIEDAESSRLQAATNKISDMCRVLFVMKRKLELASAESKHRLVIINERIDKCELTLRNRRRNGKSKSSMYVKSNLFTSPEPHMSFYFQYPTCCKIENSEYEDALQSNYKYFNAISLPKPWNKSDQRKLYGVMREAIIKQQSRKLDAKMCKIYDIIAKTDHIRKLDTLHRFYNSLVKKKNQIKNSSLTKLMINYPDAETDWKSISSKYFRDRFSAEECEQLWNLVAHPLINHKPWGKIEDLYLKSLVSQHGEQNWESINRALNTGRTPFLCFVRYSCYFKRPERKVAKIWSAGENALVNSYIDRYPKNENFYSSLVTQFTSVTRKQLKSHVAHVKNSRDKKKGRFSCEEKFLMNLYIRKGYSCDKIARKLGKRTAKQIRDFKSNVAEVTTRKPWTSKEIQKLLLVVKYNGIGRWKEICKYIPNRSWKSCQNKYTLLKSKNPSLIEKSIRKVPRVSQIRTMLHYRKTSVDCKIESFFVQYYDRKATPYQGNPAIYARAVLNILTFLGFQGVPRNASLTEIGSWLMKFSDPANHETNYQKQRFDKLFKNFLLSKQTLMHLKWAKFSQILPKNSQVLPPNKCTIYGFDNLKRNFGKNFQSSNGVNFEDLWTTVNSTYGKHPEFIKAKLLLYRTMKALFYWPLKLNTIPVDPKLL